MAKISVEIPSGKYCNGCILHESGLMPHCEYYEKVTEIEAIYDHIYYLKCPACLKACEEKEGGR